MLRILLVLVTMTENISHKMKEQQRYASHLLIMKCMWPMQTMGTTPGGPRRLFKMAEKILQAEEAFGYPKPTWLDGNYYVQEIVRQP